MDEPVLFQNSDFLRSFKPRHCRMQTEHENRMELEEQ